MKEYQEIIIDLTRVLNNKSFNGKGKIKELFKDSLRDLARFHGIELSTKFLRGLITSGKNNRQKTYRLSYLLRNAGLKKRKQNRYFNLWENQIRDIDVIEYAHKEGKKIYYEECVLTDIEKQQLTEIEEVKRAYGIELVKYPLIFSEISEQKRKGHNPTLPERQNLRKAINSNGNKGTEGVYIKNVGTAKDVNNFFKTTEKEVLIFPTGF